VATHKQRKGHFIKLDDPLVDSEAWGDLSPYAQAVFVAIKRRFFGMRKDPIVCPYSKFNGHMSKPAFYNAMRDLETHGLIKIRRQPKLEQRPNQYFLSEDWRAWKK